MAEYEIPDIEKLAEMFFVTITNTITTTTTKPSKTH